MLCQWISESLIKIRLKYTIYKDENCSLLTKTNDLKNRPIREIGIYFLLFAIFVKLLSIRRAGKRIYASAALCSPADSRLDKQQ